MALRETLRSGRPAFGSLTLLPEPALGEMLGAIGYDFLIIDTEHSALDGAGLLAMIRGANAGGLAPLVRIRNLEEKEILWVLDAGARGVVAPLVADGASARRLNDFCKFPPEGARTLCSATRAAAHGALRDHLSGYLGKENEEIVTVALVETPEGVERIDEITAEGVDVVMVGRADLSLKMGFGYAPRHPAVVEASEHVLRRTIRAGKVAGVLAYSAEEGRRWLDFGCRFIVYNQPEMVLTEHYRRALQSLREWSSD